MKRCLVVGGAGYIGGSVVWALHRAGFLVEILDDLSSGQLDGLPGKAKLHKGSLQDGPFLSEVLDASRPEIVFHLASRIDVGESVRAPLRYLRNDVDSALGLIEAMISKGIRKLVFSSSASVYAASSDPIPETAPARPTNPYGESKLFIDRSLEWISRRSRLEAISLRFFNAAGAFAGRAERHLPETHLIPNILKAAAGTLPHVEVFGTRHPTPDGTCLRDYVHVGDIAEAHLAALQCLRPGHQVFNVGSGKASSVAEVIRTAGVITGRTIPVRYRPRRPGDPPALVADPTLLMKASNWRPRRSSLSRILSDAWNCHPDRPRNPGGRRP